MNTDYITMLGNLSQSLYPIQRLITGGGYLLGTLFIMTAFFKFKKVSSHGSREHMFSPIMYLLIGAVLIFLPSTLEVMSNTAFGTGNILAIPYNKVDVRSTVILLIRTVGIVWFIRGCVLVAHASEPGKNHGLKGMLFIISGLFAINFEGSVAMMNWTLNNLLEMTGMVKT